MKRLMWVAFGAGAGVAAVRKLSQTAQSYHPRGLAQGLGKAADEARALQASIRISMAEREAQLRAALALDESESTPQARRQKLAELDEPLEDFPDFDRPTNPALRARRGH